MRRSDSKTGFTLIELLTALTFTAIVSTIIYGSFARTFDTREFVLGSQERYQTVRAALDRMAREISMAFVYDCREMDTTTGEHRYRTPFKVESAGKVDRMTFASFSHLRLFKNVHESDQNIISYFGENDPKESAKTNLMRREKTIIDGEPDKGGKTQILCPGIEELNFELWDETKEDWVDEWNCSQVEQLNRLPHMVRISLTVINEYGEEIPFSTIARIFILKPLANWIKPSQ